MSDKIDFKLKAVTKIRSLYNVHGVNEIPEWLPQSDSARATVSL